MKGFAAILLLLAGAAALAALLASHARAHERPSDQAARAMLSYERQRGLQLEFRHAVAAALSAGEGPSRHQRVSAAAESLSAFESAWEPALARRGIRADAWAGVTTAAQQRQMLQATAGLQRPVKCPACLDLSAVADEERAVTGFLDVLPSGKLGVSRTGASLYDGALRASFAAGGFGLGVSYYDAPANQSGVVLLQEGFS